MGRKVRKVIVITSMISLSILSGLGGITSFAKGPGEAATSTKTESTQINITTYNQSVVAGLGNWIQADGNVWKFQLNTGGYLTNSWIESLTEAGAFYYVDSNGNMLVNTVTPDGYSVDVNGIWRNSSSSNIANPNSNGTVDESKVAVDNQGRNADGGLAYQEELDRYIQEHYLGVGNYGSIQ